MKKIIVIAGATGNLGERIVRSVLLHGGAVHALVRNTTPIEKIEKLQAVGANVVVIKNWDIPSISSACAGADCVVSALAGLKEVIIDAQTVLLNAAVAAGVPRFIPSDFSLDFTKFTHGENRNLDIRREFHTYLNNAPIKATSIFNGAFMDMLTGQMPVILFKPKMVLYWGDKNHLWHFTSMDDTATYTAFAALDENTPRYLVIAGEQISPVRLRTVVNKVTDTNFKLIRTGSQGLLSFFIKVARKIAPGKNELYPAWQGMQYMHNMIDKRSTIEKLDNDRYPNLTWTSTEALLGEYEQERRH